MNINVFSYFIYIVVIAFGLCFLNESSNLNANQLKIEEYNDDVIDILLNYGWEDPSEVIFKAVINEDYQSVDILLNYGIETFSISRDMNITDVACLGNSLAMIKYLIEEKGISPTKDPYIGLINPGKFPHSDHIHGRYVRGYPFKDAIDYFLSIGYPLPDEALLLANNKKELIHFLLERGANISPIANNDFFQKIYRDYGYIKGALEFNQLSIDNIVRRNLGTRDLRLKSEIQSATANFAKLKEKFKEEIKITKHIIDIICSQGVDPNQEVQFIVHNKCLSDVNSDALYSAYNTPLLIAVADQDMNMIKKLISYGAEINFSGKQAVVKLHSNYNNILRSITPIELAATFSDKSIAKLLLQFRS